MKIHNLKKSIFFKIVCFIVIFSFLPLDIMTPTPVYAGIQGSAVGGHDNWMITSTWDSTGTLNVNVHEDSCAMGDTYETTQLKNKTKGNKKYLDWTIYSALVAGTDPFALNTAISESDNKFGDRDLTNTGLVYSFPSYDRDRNDSHSFDIDMARAQKISSTLGSNMNTLISSVKDMVDFKNTVVAANPTVDYVAASIQIVDELKGVADGNVHELFGNKIIFCGDDNYGDWSYGNAVYSSDGYKEIDEEGNLLAYIFNENDGDEAHKAGHPSKADSGVIWAMPKGYLDPTTGTQFADGRDPYGVRNDNMPDSESKGDAVWVTIFSIANYATAQAQYSDVTTEGVGAGVMSWVEETIYKMFYGIYTGLTNALGLQTIEQLIYNGGARSNASYEAGMMSASWWGTVLKYHLIFQIVAWMIIAVAVAKVLIQINFSTINPSLRMSLMETLQKFVIVGFSLALCIPFIRLLATFNNLIVDLFQTQADGGLMGASSFGIAGIIILLGFLGITVVMNGIYIMRAIMIALLTASAPLFIVSMAFSGPKQKGLFDNWLKEISANIFMQSVHAFSFAFLFDVMGNTNGLFTKLVIYFSLLPIIDSFRQLIFGNAGSFAVSQGKAGAQTAFAAIENKALGVAAGGANIAAGAITKKYGGDNPAVQDLSVNRDIGATNGVGGGGKSGSGGAGSVGKDAAVGNLSTAGKALKDNGSGKARAAGHALSGASKAISAYKGTGGIMGNAATRANLGDVAGSVKASENYGNSITDDIGTASADIGQVIDKHNERMEGKTEKQEADAMNNLNSEEMKDVNNYRAQEQAVSSAKDNLKQLKENKASKADIKQAKQDLKQAKSYLSNSKSSLSSDAAKAVKAGDDHSKYARATGSAYVNNFNNGKNEVTTFDDRAIGEKEIDSRFEGCYEIKNQKMASQAKTFMAKDSGGNYHRFYQENNGSYTDIDDKSGNTTHNYDAQTFAQQFSGRKAYIEIDKNTRQSAGAGRSTIQGGVDTSNKLAERTKNETAKQASEQQHRATVASMKGQKDIADKNGNSIGSVTI